MQDEGAGERRTRAPSFSFLQEGGQGQSVGVVVSLITSDTQSPDGEGRHVVWVEPSPRATDLVRVSGGFGRVAPQCPKRG